MIWLELGRYLSDLVVTTWLISLIITDMAQFRGREPADWVRAVRAEVRPFVPFAALTELFCMLIIRQSLFEDIWATLMCVFALVLWVYRKDDDDDRWKRRRDKVTGKIKNLGHKLVAVPAEG